MEMTSEKRSFGVFDEKISMPQEQFNAMCEILKGSIKKIAVIDDCGLLCVFNSSENICSYDTKNGILYYEVSK